MTLYTRKSEKGFRGKFYTSTSLYLTITFFFVQVVLENIYKVRFEVRIKYMLTMEQTRVKIKFAIKILSVDLISNLIEIRSAVSEGRTNKTSPLPPNTHTHTHKFISCTLCKEHIKSVENRYIFLILCNTAQI
jgi:hypothetical protein